METGQSIYIFSQLILGAGAAFLAILLWPKTREAAWMLVIFGTIVAYIETVYSILKIFGIAGDEYLILDTIPLVSFILPTVRMTLFIIAFTVMIYKQSRREL
ncbi:MAG: hypothetical protein FWD22_02330 [Treponema sp.]|nr:hypothetical protein [Treponema sp.]